MKLLNYYQKTLKNSLLNSIERTEHHPLRCRYRGPLDRESEGGHSLKSKRLAVQFSSYSVRRCQSNSQKRHIYPSSGSDLPVGFAINGLLQSSVHSNNMSINTVVKDVTRNHGVIQGKSSLIRTLAIFQTEGEKHLKTSRLTKILKILQNVKRKIFLSIGSSAKMGDEGVRSMQQLGSIESTRANMGIWKSMAMKSTCS